MSGILKNHLGFGGFFSNIFFIILYSVKEE